MFSMRIRSAIPWWSKIPLKIVLARLPISIRTWNRLGIFIPGSMRDHDFAILVFESHWHRLGRPNPGFNYLEIGPGEMFSVAIIAWAFGAQRGTLVDSGDYATHDLRSYQPLLKRLSVHPWAVRNVNILRDCKNIDALLKTINVDILYDGIQSLEQLPSQSFDLTISQATLEHIPLQEFEKLTRELYRVQKAPGLGSHHIDFMDHLQGSLHNLRFSKKLWEKPWFAYRSGFYTNRIPLSRMIELFETAGFEVNVTERKSWPFMPLSRDKMDRAFQDISDEDLKTAEAVLVLNKRE